MARNGWCSEALKRHAPEVTRGARGRVSGEQAPALIWEGESQHALTLAGGIQSRVLVGLVDVDEGKVISLGMQKRLPASQGSRLGPARQAQKAAGSCKMQKVMRSSVTETSC